MLRKLDLVLVACRLVGGHFAFVHCALRREPGGELHQAGGQAHAFRGISERFHARQALKPRRGPVRRDGRRILLRIHALLEQGAERIRSGQPFDEGHGPDGLAKTLNHAALTPYQRENISGFCRDLSV